MLTKPSSCMQVFHKPKRCSTMRNDGESVEHHGQQFEQDQPNHLQNYKLCVEMCTFHPESTHFYTGLKTWRQRSLFQINDLFRDNRTNTGAGRVNNTTKDWYYTSQGVFRTINLKLFLNGHISLSGLLCLITGNDRLPPQSFLLCICVWQDNSRACCWPPRHMSDWVVRLGVYIMLAAFSDEEEGWRLGLDE